MVRSGTHAVILALAACTTGGAHTTARAITPHAPAVIFDRDRELARARAATNLDEAEAHYRAVIGNDPDDPANEELVRLQIDRELADDAVTLAATYYKRRHAPARIRLYLDAIFAAKRTDIVIDLATELQRNEPGDVADGYYSRALVAIGKFDEAGKQLDKLVAAHPDEARFHLWLAEAQRGKSKTVSAAAYKVWTGRSGEQAILALSHDQTLLRAYWVLDEIFAGTYSLEERKTTADGWRHATTGTRSAVPWARLAWWSPDRKQSIAAIQHAVEIEPNRGDYWSAYARLLDRDDDVDLVRHALQQAVSVQRPDLDAAEMLGPILVEQGLLDAASDLAKRVAGRDTEHLVLGAIATRQLDRKAAIRELDQFLASGDHDSELEDAVGRCIYELQRDEPRECAWFDATYVEQSRACRAREPLHASPRTSVRVEPAAVALHANPPGAIRISERGSLVTSTGERVPLAVVRTTRGEDVRLEIAVATRRTVYILHGARAWLEPAGCPRRELSGDERNAVEDMSWRLPELIGRRVADNRNRVGRSGTTLLLLSPTGARVDFQAGGSDIVQLAYTDDSGSFSERLEDWRTVDGMRVPFRRRISIYGTEALVLDVESVAVEPPLDDATFGP